MLMDDRSPVNEQPTNPKRGTTGIGFVILLGAAGFLLWRLIAGVASGGGC